jgi:hypothetical protein
MLLDAGRAANPSDLKLGKGAALAYDTHNQACCLLQLGLRQFRQSATQSTGPDLPSVFPPFPLIALMDFGRYPLPTRCEFRTEP